jgi:hypothetical protein
MPVDSMNSVIAQHKIGVCFDWHKLNSESENKSCYGAIAWIIFWQSIHPKLFPNITLYMGDIGQSNSVFCIGMTSPDANVIAEVRRMFEKSTRFKEVCAEIAFIDSVALLVETGSINHEGNLITDGDNLCSSAFERMKFTNLPNQSDQLISWSDDSGDDALGAVDRISRNEVFSFQLARDENEVLSLKIGPSAAGARHPGNKNIIGEGDHISAYVLLLQTIACCKSNKIKQLPDIFYQVAVGILPGQVKFFKEQRELFELKLERMRIVRKTATATLRTSDSLVLEDTKKGLIFAEFEAVARYIEMVGNEFVCIANAEDDAARSKERKVKKLPFIAHSQPKPGAEKQAINRLISFDQMLGDFSDKITDDNLKTAYISNNAIGSDLAYFFDVSNAGLPASGYDNRTEKHRKWLLSEIETFQNPRAPTDKKKWTLKRVAEYASDLYDYTATGIDTLDDLNILYTTLSKHIKLIFAALPNFKNFSTAEQEKIRFEIVDKVLSKQGWDGKARMKIDRKHVLEEMKKIELQLENKMKSDEAEVAQRFSRQRQRVSLFETETNKRKEIQREYESASLLLPGVSF